MKAWQCFMSSADRLASLHASICRLLVSEDGDRVRTWQKDTFHKKLFGGFKEAQDIETGFVRAQKPWAKKLKKVLPNPGTVSMAIPTTLLTDVPLLSAAGQGPTRLPQSEPEGAGGPRARPPRPGEPRRLHRQAEEDPGGESAGAAGGREGSRNTLTLWKIGAHAALWWQNVVLFNSI